MVRWSIVLLIGFYLVIPLGAVSQNKVPNQQRFEELAHKMHVKTPKLAGGEYEIRIWNQQGLMFGDAQALYVLVRTEQRFSIMKYVIFWDGPVFSHATRFKPTIPVTDSLWKQLLNENILTLPDEKAIWDKLHPKPRKDSTWNVIEADGTINVKAKRKMDQNIMISDGEGYYFEIFSPDTYHGYGYSNPELYIRYKPDIPELQNVVAILNSMATLFRSKN